MTTPTLEQIRAAAQTILTRYDQHMGASPRPLDDDGAFYAIVSAIGFAGAAREHAADPYAGEATAFRALMLALIDPLHPELDYLRADPTSAAAARESRHG